MIKDKKSKKHRVRTRPFLALFGYNEYSADSGSLSEILNICSRLQISYRDVMIENERAFFITPFFSSARLKILPV